MLGERPGLILRVLYASPLLLVLAGAACGPGSRAPGDTPRPADRVETAPVRAFDDFTPGELHHRAALIQVQHVAVSLLQARERGLTPAEQGREVGAVFARYKDRLLWHRSSHWLHFNALSKLLDDDYEVEVGRGSFTLMSRYAPVDDVLASYESSITDYASWLEGLHEVIGPIQGYAMTAEIDGDWLVETYRDLPPREDLIAASDLPDIRLTPAERTRHVGRYVESEESEGSGDPRWVLSVWEEDGRLRLVFYPVNGREGHGGHLIPVADGVFRPGWYPEQGPPEVDLRQTVRFPPQRTGPARRVEVELGAGSDRVVYRFVRVDGSGG